MWPWSTHKCVTEEAVCDVASTLLYGWAGFELEIPTKDLFSGRLKRVRKTHSSSAKGIMQSHIHTISLPCTSHPHTNEKSRGKKYCTIKKFKEKKSPVIGTFQETVQKSAPQEVNEYQWVHQVLLHTHCSHTEDKSQWPLPSTQDDPLTEKPVKLARNGKNNKKGYNIN